MKANTPPPQTRALACALAAFCSLLFPHFLCGQATVTFSDNHTGTHPETLHYDKSNQILTIDLSALPRNATLFRAELVLNPAQRFDPAQLKPTRVHPADHPDRNLSFVPPRFVGLDALPALQEALQTGKPLRLKLANTLRGVKHLEVSYLEGKPPPNIPTVKTIQAIHHNGQSLITFTEPTLLPFPQFAVGKDVARFRNQLLREHPELRFRIWRSKERITPRTIARAKLVGECKPLTAWNNRYHQGDTPKRPPLRYRVNHNAKPVDWGTGIYAHNPESPGPAFYAVTVAINGQENLRKLTPANCTPEPLAESVGQGEPILQWIEKPDPAKGWHYRRGEIARLIYTRWENGSHSSIPNNPIDYLVAIPLQPRPDTAVREAQHQAFRIDPAPVGLHLHCWGGSCNGGYGWWYNAHRGSILIASTQIPYDWWTGYHQARDTHKTWGDGDVHPYTMTRLFAFLDWAAKQWREAPESIRPYWPKLDLSRVFAAGNSMGGSGAPMFAIRHGQQIAWSISWVGVHVPELSPSFSNSYKNVYGPRNSTITMPDRKTSPWDFYSDVWWMHRHIAADTGLIIASNGKNDGGIGWKQAVLFARALQETRRPHMFNWAMGGHGTRTLIGSNFDLDIRSDQSLPAFSNCSLDDPIGNGQPTSGTPSGQYNAHLRWDPDSLLDSNRRWEITVSLLQSAPDQTCTTDLTPRRCQNFRPAKDTQFSWTNTSLESGQIIQSGTATTDPYGLVTLQDLRISKSSNRIVITGN